MTDLQAVSFGDKNYYKGSREFKFSSNFCLTTLINNTETATILILPSQSTKEGKTYEGWTSKHLENSKKL